MNLTYRPTLADDLEPAFALIADRPLYGDRARGELLALWRHLLATRCAISMVVEDFDREDGDRLVGVGMSTFVTDAFAVEVALASPPHIASQVLHRWRRGHRVWLTPREVGRAHAGDGLNLAILHYGWRPLSDGVATVALKIMESFFWSHAGYRIKTFFETVYGGPMDLAARLNNGLRLYREHQHVGPTASGEERTTYLVGARRADPSISDLNLALSRLFHAPPARFGFSTVERETLLHALSGGTDHEAAEALGVSVWTVKKRWQAIYAKVDRVDDALLSTGIEETREPEAVVGRRRRLLAYLQQHFEEVRPLQVPRARR